MKRLYDVRYREIPVPSTLADYGIGVELEAGERMDSHPFAADSVSGAACCHRMGNDVVFARAAPRLEFNWRCVAFARLPLEPSENDSLAPGMYWEDMCDYLGEVEPDSISGTVTVTQNTTFGLMARQHQRRLRDTCLMDAT